MSGPKVKQDTALPLQPATGRGGSTVRPHVKHMFTRHGLSRQADLVWLVLSPGSAPESRR